MATTAITSEVGNDHKHWLRDIERWDAYLRIWQNQIHELTQEYRKLLKTSRAARRRRRRILRGSRVASQRIDRRRASHLRTSPSQRAGREAWRKSCGERDDHDELYKAHERLKQIQHTLMAGLALLKHEPYRDE